MVLIAVRSRSMTLSMTRIPPTFVGGRPEGDVAATQFPVVAAAFVDSDVGSVRPLPGTVAAPVQEVRIGDGGRIFIGGRMDDRVRKVRESATMFEIHMRQHDRCHVHSLESVLLDLRIAEFESFLSGRSKNRGVVDLLFSRTQGGAGIPGCPG